MSPNQSNEESLEYSESNVVHEYGGDSVYAKSTATSIYDPRKLMHFNRFTLIISGLIMLGVLVIGLIVLGITSAQSKNKTSGNKQDSYKVSQLPSQNIPESPLLAVKQASQLAINGQLTISNSLVLVPGSEPESPVQGQVYYDADNNAPLYYDGNSFVSLKPQESVTAIAGVSGAITLGNGLSVNGSVLNLSTDILNSTGNRVTSFQGQSGAVTLSAGQGIAINGTTISSTGITSLAGSNGIAVALNNGAATISLPQVLGTTASPTFAGLQLSSALGVSSGGTGFASGNLIPNAVMITNSSGTAYELAAGVTGGQCLITDGTDNNKIKFGSCTGSVFSGVTSLNAVDGDVAIVSNTLNVSVDSVNKEITLDLPQPLATTSSPTFANLTATSFAGNGSAVTGVNAVQLNGQAASFYQNAGNLTAGALADARLSANVTLLNAVTNNFTGALQQGGNNVCTTANNCNYLTGSAASGAYIQLQGATPGTVQTGNFNISGTGRANALYQNGFQVCDTSGNCGGDGVGVTALGALDSQTRTNNGATIIGSNLYLQTATTSFAGLMGTGNQTFAGTKTFNGGVTLGGTANLTLASACGAGQVLTAGAGGIVSCVADVVGGGDGVGVTSIGAVNGQTKSANGAVIVGADLFLQTADATSIGLVSTGAQTFGGAKTFNGGVTLGAGASLTLASACGAGQVLTAGAGGIVSCVADVVGGGDGVGVTTVGTINSQTKSADGAVIVGSNVYLQTADSTNVGLVSTAAQTFAGTKTFSNGVTLGTGANLTLASACGAGQVLTAGVGGTVACVADAVGSGDGVGVTTVGTIDSQTKSLNGAVIVGSNVYLQTADATNVGLVSTGTQTFGGAKTFNGALTLGSSLTVGANNVAFQRNTTDYTTVGISNNVNFGTGVLFRLNGASAQTITGIAGGTDGRIMTLVNAGTNATILSNNSASSLAANRIITGTGADISLASGASVELGYDSASSVWRVIGGVAGSGVTISGTSTNGVIAKFNGSGQILNSGLSESGTTMTYGGNAVINAASGFTGNLIDVQLNGASRFSVNNLGNTTVAGTLAVSGAISTNGTQRISSTGALSNVSIGTTQGIVITNSTTGLLTTLSSAGATNKCLGYDGSSFVWSDCTGSGGGSTGYANGGNGFTTNGGNAVSRINTSYDQVIANPVLGLTSNVALDLITNNISRINIADNGNIKVLSNSGNSSELFVVRTRYTGSDANQFNTLRVDTLNDSLGRVGIGLPYAQGPEVRLDIGGNSSSLTNTANGGVQIWASAAPGLSHTGSNGGSSLGSGRIYFDQLTGKFKVSENGGSYVDLIQGTGGVASFLTSGNAVTADATLGTTNVYGLNIITNGSTRLAIDNQGDARYNVNNFFDFMGAGVTPIVRIDKNNSSLLIGTTTSVGGAGLNVGSAINATGYRVSGVNGVSLNCGSGTQALGSFSFSSGILTSGSCSANNSDLAEAYNSSDALEAGELVMAAGTSATDVKRATAASANGGLMGIVSTAPSQTIGTAQVPNGYPVALSGRVPTKVNGEGGPIAVGDKITISSVPGVGKKATNRGMIVGTAVESFNGVGTGSIEVFVNLTYYQPSDTDMLQAQMAAISDLNVSGSASIKNLAVTGLLTVQNIVVEGHIITASGQPTATVQASAGESATILIEGNDTTGTITLTTGSEPVAGDLANIVFSELYGKAPRVVLSPSNSDAADLNFFKGKTTTDKFTFSAKNAPQANTTYKFDYFIAE